MGKAPAQGADSLGCSDLASGRIPHPRMDGDMARLDMVPLEYLVGAVMEKV